MLAIGLCMVFTTVGLALSYILITKYICQPEDKFEGTPARPSSLSTFN